MIARAVSLLEAVLGRVHAVLAYAVAISIGLFAVSISLDWLLLVLGRGSIPWLAEVIEYALYAGVMLTAPWLLREGAHVRVDVLLASLPERVMVGMERFLGLLGAAISGVLCVYAARAALDAYLQNAKEYKSSVTVDVWWLLAILVVAAFLLTLEFLLRVARAREGLERQRDAVARDGTGF